MVPPSLAQRIAGPTIVGALVLLTFIGGFGAWAALVPLSSAAIAQGVISPEGSRRIVQHLEGGIVQDILVTEGDQVEQGQPVLILQEIQARASHDRAQSQWRRAKAIRQRIQALQSKEEKLEFTADIVAYSVDDPGFSDFLETQQNLFSSVREAHNGKINILGQQIAQLDESIKGHAVEEEGADTQLALLDEELEGLNKLVDRGLAMKPRILQLSRERARALAQKGAAKAAGSQAQQKIAETELEILNERSDFTLQQATELTEVNSQIAQLAEQMTATGDVLARTEIRAPVRGTIVSLNVKTRSGVIRPGETLMEIVPSDEALVIDARLSPIDIDIVHPGLMAQVHLLPYSQRYTAPLEGIVARVASDTAVDQATQQSYYSVQIHVDREKLSRQHSEINLAAGMPAEIYIVTGSRTMVDYLSEPVIRSFRRSFREQ